MIKTHKEKDEITLLVFKIAVDLYAISVESVVEVIPIKKISPVPKEEDYIVGIINFRGDIISVIDFEKKAGKKTKQDDKHVIIIFDFEKENIRYILGALASSVNKVIRVKKNDINPKSDFGTVLPGNYLTGNIRTDEGFAHILDPEKVLF